MHTDRRRGGGSVRELPLFAAIRGPFFVRVADSPCAEAVSQPDLFKAQGDVAG